MKSAVFFKLLPALLLSLGSMGVALAQGTTPTNGGPAPGPVTPVVPADVPVDGGVSLLLAGGVAYGIRHLRQRRRAA